MESHEVADFLQTGLARRATARGVPGAAVAVVIDGQIIDHAVGVLSTATEVEATPESVFQIGSITKVWTATMVMQLVDDGLIELDEPIRTYLPEFRLSDDSAAGRVAEVGRLDLGDPDTRFTAMLELRTLPVAAGP